MGKDTMTEVPKSEGERPNKDVEILKNHVRLIKGLELPKKKIVKRRRLKESKPKLNLTHRIRTECIKKRKNVIERNVFVEKNEPQKIHQMNLTRKRSVQFQLNKAFHMRWKMVRKLPVIPSYCRKVFEETGKLPFVVPTFYKPFDVYWDAEWSKHEFIFLDEAGEEKKKSEAPQAEGSTTAIPSSTTTTTVTTTVQPSPQIK